MPNQAWLGRFEITDSSKDFSVDDGGGAQAVALDTGFYYIRGTSGETQLVEHMEDKIQALGGNFTTTTVTYDATDGKVDINFAGAYSLTWTDTDLRDLLGFSANITTTQNNEGTNEARYCWRPDRGMSDHPVQLNQFWDFDSTTMAYVSNDGTSYSTVGRLLKRAVVEYTMLDDARVIIPSTGSINQELQQFYSDVVHQGQPVRVFFDDTSVTSGSDYVAGIVMPLDGGKMPTFTEFSSRHISSYDGLWDVSIPLREYLT